MFFPVQAFMDGTKNQKLPATYNCALSRGIFGKSDIVSMPIAAIGQHGIHLPLWTDFLNGAELAKLISPQVDVLVRPILLPEQSPCHMGFAGTISFKAETVVQVHFEAVQFLIAHWFNSFLVMNAHGGNRAITAFIVDKINQETAGIAVDLGEAVGAFTEMSRC